MLQRRPALILVLSSGFATGGCGEVRDSNAFGSGAAAVTATDTAATAATAATAGSTTHDGPSASEASDAAPDDTTDDPKFDLNANGEVGDGPMGEGCDKVDFLFVIDSSFSMVQEQDNLVNSFPGFIDTIKATLSGDDFHLMVVDTDANPNGSMTSSICTPDPECCEQKCLFEPQTICNDKPCPAACGVALGAGVINDQNGQVCPITGGRRYIQDEQPNLEDTFSCIARVGTEGSGGELPMGAIGHAVSPAMNSPGGCNEGFLRDDAILVVTFITDEPGEESALGGNPTDWYDRLVASKGGNDNAIVVLGLFGDSDQNGGVCAAGAGAGAGATPAPRLREFVEMFGDHGRSGSVCEPDYAPFFTEAVATIDVTCNEFRPEG